MGPVGGVYENHQHRFGPGGLRRQCGAWHPDVSAQEIDRLLRVARELDVICAQSREMSSRTPLPVHRGPAKDYRFPSRGEMVGFAGDGW